MEKQVSNVAVVTFRHNPETGKQEKFQLPVTSREHYLNIRKEAEELVKKYRETGDAKFKNKLPQLTYSCPVYEEGGVLLKENNTQGMLFQFDIDLGDMSEARKLADQMLERKDELGLGVIEITASGGIHAVALSHPGTTILENQVRLATALHVEMDTNAHDVHRVLFTTGVDDLVYLDDRIFTCTMTKEQAEANFVALKSREKNGEEVLPLGARNAKKHYCPWLNTVTDGEPSTFVSTPTSTVVPEQTTSTTFAKNDEGKLLYRGIIAYEDIIAKWNEMYYDGTTPCDGDRHVRILELARHFRCLTDYQQAVLDAIIPNYPDSKGNPFPQKEKQRIIKDALSYKLTGISSKVRKVLEELRVAYIDSRKMNELISETQDETDKYYANLLYACFNAKCMKHSFEGIPADLRLQGLFVVLALVGGIATKVRLNVHGKMRHLNLLPYCCGKSASGKDRMSELYQLWCHELLVADKVFQKQEQQWEEERNLASLSDNIEPKKELHLQRRIQSARTTVPKLLQRLRDSQGQHLITFMSESDVLSENNYFFKTAKVLLRLAWDEDSFANDVKSTLSTNIIIEHVLWLVIMCGTKDALERLIAGNYRDGVANRISYLKMPDNTFKKYKAVRPRSELSKEYVYHVSRLLNMMEGDLDLPRLEDRAVQWVDNVCEEAAAINDEPMAALRFRICVAASRFTAAMLLCKYADKLIAQLDNHGNKELPSWADGCVTAEEYLKKHPEALQKHINQLLTADMLNCYDAMADYLLDTSLYYCRTHMEDDSMNSAHSEGKRHRRGLNDGIFNQLKEVFTTEDAAELKASTPNAIRQMLKNWEQNGYIEQQDDGTWKKQVASL